MEPFLYFIFSLIISSSVTFGYIRYIKFTKRGIYKNMINSHLETIKNSLENVTEFPCNYCVGETNDFTIQLADDISKKLRRKGFKVSRNMNEFTTEVLLISYIKLMTLIEIIILIACCIFGCLLIIDEICT